MLRETRAVKWHRRSVELALYRTCLVFKLLGVVLYAGGMVAAFVTMSPAERKFAVHRIAAVGVALIWVFGYLLTQQLAVALTEMWILGGFLASAVSKLSLVKAATREKPTRSDMIRSGMPFVVAIVLMVFRPTWEMFKR